MELSQLAIQLGHIQDTYDGAIKLAWKPDLKEPGKASVWVTTETRELLFAIDRETSANDLQTIIEYVVNNRLKERE